MFEELASVVVLIDCFQPANIVVCVRHYMNVQHVVIGGMARLEEDKNY